MIKSLMHDPIFLGGKSVIATKEDLQVAEDLLDTLVAHKESCVGMAANMIGVKKRIIAFLDANPHRYAESFDHSAEELRLSWHPRSANTPAATEW